MILVFEKNMISFHVFDLSEDIKQDSLFSSSAFFSLTNDKGYKNGFVLLGYLKELKRENFKSFLDETIVVVVLLSYQLVLKCSQKALTAMVMSAEAEVKA